MGSEARCRAELDGQVFEDAKALLETEELIVRGAARAKVPFREVRVQSVVEELGIKSSHRVRKTSDVIFSEKLVIPVSKR